MILNFCQWFKEEMSFKHISIFSSGDHFAQGSRSVCAILVESIMRNISVKLVSIWDSG